MKKPSATVPVTPTISKTVGERITDVLDNKLLQRIGAIIAIFTILVLLVTAGRFIFFKLQSKNYGTTQATPEVTPTSLASINVTETSTPIPTPTTELTLQEIEDQSIAAEFKKFTSGSDKKPADLPISNHKISIPKTAAITSVTQKITKDPVYGDLTSDDEGTCLKLNQDLSIETATVACRYDRISFEFWSSSKLSRKTGEITIYYNTYPEYLTDVTDETKAKMTSEQITFLGKSTKYTHLGSYSFLITTLNGVPVTVSVSGDDSLKDVYSAIIASF